MSQNPSSSMTEQTSSTEASPSSGFQHGVGQISSPEGAGMGGAAESSAQAHQSAVPNPTPAPSEGESSAGAHPTRVEDSPDVEEKDPRLEVSTAREPGERGESKE